MATERPLPPSFTPGRKWGIGFSKLVGLVAVLAIIGMVNYISHNFFFLRSFLSTQARVQLSPQTIGLLKTVTNQVHVTLYYDRGDELFSTVNSLLSEYSKTNPKISVDVVDYTSSPAEAQRIKVKYKLDAPTDKNLVIFDCADRVKMVNGDAFMDYTTERVPNKKELEFRKKPVAFKGEMLCSTLLMAVLNPVPQRAYYLTGHGEHALSDGKEQTGYLKFATVIALQNYVSLDPLSLLGTNVVPADCNVLIIAGPSKALAPEEVAKIERYLTEGGRLLALLGVTSVDKEVGLEKLLAKWGVNVSSHLIKDDQNSLRGQDVVVKSFSKHEVVNALQESSIHLILPREISRIETSTTAADAPSVDELAFTGPDSTFADATNSPAKPRPVAVAVEQGAVKGVANGRGTTRIVVIGDSIFLGNQMIDSAANRDFENYALNWLLNRQELLQGLGPRPVSEFKIIMTRSQLKSAYIILLGGLPGAALLIGTLVWLRRRN
jgi:ABC-type uncharacterized transport system involved in gliding motility auxiliary subunit